MPNLEVGKHVTINESDVSGKIIQVGQYTVVLVDEEGNHHSTGVNNVTPQSFLTEIENDGRKLL